jgi:pimeloyl-ACP methyl ester carboxylesterase
VKGANPEIIDFDEARSSKDSLSFASISGSLTHYKIAGPRGGLVVVLVPGMSVPAYIWNPTRAYLLKEGYRVLSYDFPGRGRSQPAACEYDTEFYRSHLLQLLGHLHLTGPMYFIGLSFGGLVVADFFARYADMVRKAAFIGPMAGMPRLCFKGVLNQMFRIFPHAIAKRQARDFKYPENFPDWVTRYEKQMRWKGFRRAIVSTLYNYKAGIDVYRKLQNRLDRVLVVYGVEDRIISFKDITAIKEALPGTFMSIPNSGHLPHLENVDATNLVLIDFFKKD